MVSQTKRPPLRYSLSLYRANMRVIKTYAERRECERRARAYIQGTCGRTFSYAQQQTVQDMIAAAPDNVRPYLQVAQTYDR